MCTIDSFIFIRFTVSPFDRLNSLSNLLLVNLSVILCAKLSNRIFDRLNSLSLFAETFVNLITDGNQPPGLEVISKRWNKKTTEQCNKGVLTPVVLRGFNKTNVWK